MPDEGVKPITWSNLSQRLGVSVQTIKNWRDNYPGECPGTPDFEEWKKFVSEKGLGVVGNRIGSEREKMLVEVLAEDLATKRLRRAKEEKRVIDREKMDDLHHRIFTRQKAVLYAALESEYPGKVAGRTAGEVRILGRQLADRITGIFSKDVEEWECLKNSD